MFIDYTKVELIAGKGGRGAVSFRREKFVPKGGPDGGDGGRGGHIIFKADENLRTLQDIRYRKMYKAENGNPGGKNNRSGKFGEDVIILVPLGTIIRKVTNNVIIADLTTPGEECIACNGGIGGKGNSRFKTSTNQTPRKLMLLIFVETTINVFVSYLFFSIFTSIFKLSFFFTDK